MIKNYTAIKNKYFAFSVLFFSAIALHSQVLTQTFTFSGASQTFVVPSCVNTITMEAWGAQGGANWSSNTNYGGYAKGTFTVSPGSSLVIYVGSQPSGTVGGFNGGGNGETSGQGGGGASDVRQGGIALSNRILVAGGGGGAGYWSSLHVVGGVGGGLTGGDGYRNTTADPGGQGGTQTGSGNGTCISLNNSAMAGGLGYGGSPSGCGCEGYGGGGGYYGGAGSGNCRGGGGGSGFILAGATNTAFTSGANVGHGKVVFSYSQNGAGIMTSASSSSICSGATATLSASNLVSYTWTPGGSNASSIAVSPTVNSSYTVQGTNSIGCISSAIITVTVDPGLPVLSIANTSSATGGICPTKTVILTASGASGYTWTGGSSTVTNGVVFSPTIAADYTVTGANACGTATAITSVSVHPFPTVSPVASSSSLCSGQSVTLTGVGNATNYAWSGGSGGITNGVGFTPGLTATYTVIGTSALSCTASATIPVTVVATPVAPPTAQPALICIGGSSTLTATGATNYTWTSATQTVNTATFVVTPNIGTTSYTVTKANANCVDVKVISVVTNPLPTIFAIVSPTIVCALNPATLAVGGAQTYTWTSPGPPTFTFTGASPVVSPPVSTTYTVAASDGTCINTTTVFLATNPNPTITTTASSPSICVGQSVTVTANGANNYTWTSTGSTNTFYTQSVTGSPTVATAYNVVGDNSFGCVTGVSQIVLVYPNPTITIAASKTLVCNNGASTLTASGAQSYTWANGSFTPLTVVNPTNITTGPVIYTVSGSYTTTGCSSTKTTQVVVFIPTLSVSGNTNTCAGGLINLTASGGNNNTYSWNTGTGNPYNFPSISSTIAAPATWTVSANTTSASVICPSSFTVALGLFYNPTITAVAQRTTICKNESVDLFGNGGVSYVWSNNMTGGTVTVPAGNGTFMNFTVTGTDANGCVNTGTVQVKISGCNGLNELSSVHASLSVYPNPNSGEFMIETDPIINNADLKLTLVNELGQLVRVITLSGTNHYKISITDLAKGIYFISGQKDNVLINQKVVVTK